MPTLHWWRFAQALRHCRAVIVGSSTVCLTARYDAQQFITLRDIYPQVAGCCVDCSALKSRTTRKLGVKEFQLATSHYLDLPSLERWLAEWKDALLSSAGGIISCSTTQLALLALLRFGLHLSCVVRTHL